MKLIKKSFFTILVFALVANFNLAGKTSSSKKSKSHVVLAVCDGDTIVVEPIGLLAYESTKEFINLKLEKKLCAYNTKLLPEQKKIRLLGIDTFEYKQNKYGPEAKEFLSMLILNKQIYIETDVEKKDVYGRTLGYIFINNLFINEELLKNGYALLYDFPPNIKYIGQLKKAQRYARQNMLGIWKESDYIKETPAQWRKKLK